MLIYAKSLLSPDSCLAESGVVVRARKVFLKEMEALAWKRKVHSWTVKPGLVPVLKCFVHIIHCPGSLYKIATLFDKFREIPLLQWSDK